MTLNAACVQRKVPVRFTSITCLHASISRSFERTRWHSGPGVVEQHVEAIELAEHLGKERNDGILTGDVGWDDQHVRRIWRGAGPVDEISERRLVLVVL